jgi:hypothetical protein
VCGPKALIVGAANGKENAMSRILTTTWLQTRTLSELRVLRGETLRALAAARHGSPAARDAAASLAAVDRMIRFRTPGPRP